MFGLFDLNSWAVKAGYYKAGFTCYSFTSAVFWVKVIQVLITIFELRPDLESLWKALSYEPIRFGLEPSQHQKMTKIKSVLTQCHLGALHIKVFWQNTIQVQSRYRCRTDLGAKCSGKKPFWCLRFSTKMANFITKSRTAPKLCVLKTAFRCYYLIF